MLVSGGLDSALAAKMIQDQGISLVAVNFTSIFCTCTSNKKKRLGCSSEAVRLSNQLGIPIRSVPKGSDYLEIIKKPNFGVGKGVNPCLDCRIYMLEKVKSIMKEEDASFIVTGEVVNQRPMSQMRNRLQLIETKTGLEGLILRPLSAKALEPTIPEKEGIIDRIELLDIVGRSRKLQIQKAEEYMLVDYPCGTGGCLLTDTNFSRKVKDIFEHDENLVMADLELLKFGRHFRLNRGCKVVVGRNEDENSAIQRRAGGEYTLEVENVPGPIALLKGGPSKDEIITAAKIVLRYSDHQGGSGSVRLLSGSNEQKISTILEIENDLPPQALRTLQI